MNNLEYRNKHYYFDEFSAFYYASTVKNDQNQGLELQHSLLNLGSNLQIIAISISKLITQSMQNVDSVEIRFSGVILIQKLLDIVLLQEKSHPEIKDEVYCQLINILDCNTSLKVKLLSFQLCICCLSSFAPSEILRPYYESYLKSYTSKTPTGSRKISIYADACLQRLELICQLGSRPFAPSITELNSIIREQGLPIEVHVPTDNIINCSIDSWTSGIDLKRYLNNRLNIVGHATFALFLTNKKFDDFELPDDKCILSFLQDLPLAETKAVGPCLRYFRNFSGKQTDHYNEFVASSYKISYRIKLYVDFQSYKRGLHDDRYIEIYYNQVLREYLSGNIICKSEDDVVDLAALASLEIHGKCPADCVEAEEFIQNSVKYLIPTTYVDDCQCALAKVNPKMAAEMELFLRGLIPKADNTSGGSLKFPSTSLIIHERNDAPLTTGNNTLATKFIEPLSPSLFASNDDDDNDSIFYFDNNACEDNSGTWMNEEISEPVVGVQQLCHKIKAAWRNSDYSITTKMQARMAFLKRIKRLSDFGATYFNVSCPITEDSAAFWLHESVLTNDSFLSRVGSSVEILSSSNKSTSNKVVDREIFIPGVSTDENNSNKLLDNFGEDLTAQVTPKLECPTYSFIISKAYTIHLKLIVYDRKLVICLRNKNKHPFLVGVNHDVENIDHSTSSDSNTASAAVQIDNVERLLTIPYESLLGWGYTSDSFIIQYYFNEQMKVDRYDTCEGDRICGLVKAYYTFPYMPQK